jgi:hypothetical protein
LVGSLWFRVRSLEVFQVFVPASVRCNSAVSQLKHRVWRMVKTPEALSFLLKVNFRDGFPHARELVF